VLAALHPIRADLGELELREDGGTLRVRGTGLSARRRDEIRRALEGIDHVDLEFADDSGGPVAAPAARRPSQKPEGAAPLRALLESRLPEAASVEQVVNQILDTSDAMMAQAFALRTLARRYTPEEEVALTASDRELLVRLRQSYGGDLNVHFSELIGMLAPMLSATPSTAVGASTWQKDAEQAFASVQALDSILSATLAGASRSSPSQAELLQQMEDAVKRAQAAVRAIQ
jgi:hypothetical protein